MSTSVDNTSVEKAWPCAALQMYNVRTWLHEMFMSKALSIYMLRNHGGLGPPVLPIRAYLSEKKFFLQAGKCHQKHSKGTPTFAQALYQHAQPPNTR
jgi:hypothetical protein